VGSKFRIGLALGGGAARGLSHIGVIEALVEAGITIDVIAGTSMGAIIGAMYAADPDVARLKERFAAYLHSDAFRQARFDFMKERDIEEGEGIFYRFSQFARRSIFYTLSMTRHSFLSESTSERNVAFLVPDISIEDTRIPFAATAVDLVSGREHLFRSGSLRLAVSASCAIPGLLPPVEYEGMSLIDGGWLDAVPVEPAISMGANFVIAVDVSREISEFEELRSGLEIVFRSDSITRYALSDERARRADSILAPPIRNIHWADFSLSQQAIDSGRQEVLLHLDEIRRKLRRKRWRQLLGVGR